MRSKTRVARLLQAVIVVCALIAPSRAVAQTPAEVTAFISDLSGSEVLELLSSIGVSAGAHLRQADNDALPSPIPVEMAVVRTLSAQEILSVWSAARPNWSVVDDGGVVTIISPGMSGAYRLIGNLSLQSIGLDQAVRAMLQATDPSAPPAEMRPDTEPLSITLNAQGMTVVEAFNALVRQVPGTTWTFTRHLGTRPYDTFRLKTSSGRSWSVVARIDPIN